MSTFNRLSIVVLFGCVAFATSSGQIPSKTDTTIIFTPSNPELIRTTKYQPLLNAWGVDLMISNNGFGLGAFLRHEFSDELSGHMSLAISDVKDEAEVERFNYYGQSFVLGKKNRLLLVPLTVGVQYRLFKDEIIDNFRPYVTAGLGPSMIFVAPYSTTTQDGGLTVMEQMDFFTSLKYGRARYTLGGYIGAGAYFGLEKGSLSGLSIRYYFVPFPSGIEVMEGAAPVKEFGGFYITLNFGSFY